MPDDQPDILNGEQIEERVLWLERAIHQAHKEIDRLTHIVELMQMSDHMQTTALQHVYSELQLELPLESHH